MRCWHCQEKVNPEPGALSFPDFPVFWDGNSGREEWDCPFPGKLGISVLQQLQGRKCGVGTADKRCTHSQEHFPDFPGFQDAIQAPQGSASALGLQAQLCPHPTGGVGSQLWAQPKLWSRFSPSSSLGGNFGITEVGRAPRTISAHFVTSPEQHPGVPWTPAGVGTPNLPSSATSDIPEANPPFCVPQACSRTQGTEILGK